MRIRPFQAVYPNLDFIASPDSFFGNVKNDYSEYRRNGFFHKTAQESIYIYQIKSARRIYTGLIACSHIADYTDGLIKKHEKTLASKEQQQLQLMLSRNATVKPVLLTYPNVAKIDQLIERMIKETPVFYNIHFEEEKQLHTLWEVSDGQVIQTFQELFKNEVDHSYIADGHHRTTTTALMHKRFKERNDQKDFDLLLSAYFPVSELDVHDYNRVIDGLNELSPASFMAKLSQCFDVDILTKGGRPKRKHELTMFFQGEWFKLKWKSKILESYGQESVLLDVTLLNELVLDRILGITDVRNDQRIRYVEGPKGLSHLRRDVLVNDGRVGFCLFPVCLNDLMMLARNDQMMPPKSTWFEPRIKNGLLVQEF